MKQIARFPLGWVLIVTLICFLPGLSNKFVLYDDDLHLFRNPYLQLPLKEAVAFFWQNPFRGFYMPVTYTFWALLVALFRPADPFVSFDFLNPLPFHAANITFHLFNVFLLYHLLKILINTPLARLLGTFVFAIHPLQVEAVSWATGLKDILATSFVLGSGLLYLKMKNPFRQPFKYLVVVGLYLLGTLSKPSVIAFPLGLSIIEIAFSRKAWRTSLWQIMPLILVAIPLATLTASLQPIEARAYVVPWNLRPWVAMDALLFYLNKFCTTFPLVHDYTRNPEWLNSSSWKFFSPTCLCVIIFLLFLKRQTKALFGLLVFALWLTPTLGLIQFAFQNFSTVADHYFYFPGVAFGIFGAALFEKVPPLSREFKIAAAALFIFAIRTVVQVQVWRDSPALLSHTLKYQPHSVLALNNFGVYYEWKEDWKNAIKVYSLALKVGPRFTHHFYNMGNLYMRMQRLEEAKFYLSETLRLQQRYPEAHFNLGLIAEAQGQSAKARDHFIQALEQDPMMGPAYIKLADQLQREGKWEQAKEFFKQGIALNPLSPQAHLHFAQALVYYEKYGHEKNRRTENSEAEIHFAEAKRLTPIHEAARTPYALMENAIR